MSAATERAPAAAAARERWVLAALAVFVAALWFALLPSRPLFNPDEGRYAEIPREMIASGDWVVPHLNGLAYVEKPPLQYWATALSLTLFGVNEFGARFYTALAALGTVLAVWVAARRLFGGAAAIRAAAALASMQLFVVLGQLLTLDMSLTLYTTWALVGFLLAQRAGASGSRRWMLLAWAATACGVLTKGPVAAVLPVGTLVLYSVWMRDASVWRRLHLRTGVPLLLAIVLPWGWLVTRRLPDFPEFFFVHEHLQRYLTPSADREEAWWFYGEVLLFGSLPWTLSALRVLATGWRAGAGAADVAPRPSGTPREFDPARFLWLWVWFVCLFFTASDSKLVPYILPALPALALLIGRLPEAVFGRDVRRAALITVLVGVGLALASRYAPQLGGAGERGRHFAAVAAPALTVALLLGVSGLFVWVRRARAAGASAVFLCAGWCLAGLLMMRAAAAVAPIYSGVSLVQALPEVPRDAVLYSVGTYDQTLPFYWRRTFLLVSYRGELDYGLRHDPEVELASVDDFVERWNMQPNAYAVMEHDTFEKLEARHLPMREIARDVRHVLVGRR